MRPEQSQTTVRPRPTRRARRAGRGRRRSPRRPHRTAAPGPGRGPAAGAGAGSGSGCRVHRRRLGGLARGPARARGSGPACCGAVGGRCPACSAAFWAAAARPRCAPARPGARGASSTLTSSSSRELGDQRGLLARRRCGLGVGRAAASWAAVAGLRASSSARPLRLGGLGLLARDGRPASRRRGSRRAARPSRPRRSGASRAARHASRPSASRIAESAAELGRQLVAVATTRRGRRRGAGRASARRVGARRPRGARLARPGRAPVAGAVEGLGGLGGRDRAWRAAGWRRRARPARRPRRRRARGRRTARRWTSCCSARRRRRPRGGRSRPPARDQDQREPRRHQGSVSRERTSDPWTPAHDSEFGSLRRHRRAPRHANALKSRKKRNLKNLRSHRRVGLTNYIGCNSVAAARRPAPSRSWSSGASRGRAVELLAAGDAAEVEGDEGDRDAGDVVGDVVPAEVEGGDHGEAEVDPEDHFRIIERSVYCTISATSRVMRSAGWRSRPPSSRRLEPSLQRTPCRGVDQRVHQVRWCGCAARSL